MPATGQALAATGLSVSVFAVPACPHPAGTKETPGARLLPSEGREATELNLSPG